MKKKILSILVIVAGHTCFSQPYVSLATSLTATAGTVADKSNIALEVGQQWDVFSLGVDFGKTTLSPVGKRDTSLYMELRPNLNVFQQGKFTNTFTPGIGYIFNAKENLLIEFTTGIEYSYSARFHINVFFGQYFYSGLTSASNVNFFGLSGAWYFGPSHTGSLVKINK